MASRVRIGSGQVTVAALLIADLVYGFQQTAITPALPTVQQDLNASREWTVWLFSGYLIVASVAPVFLGKLGDLIGQRRVYLGALAVFLLGSVGAAVAPSIQLVVALRMVQGVGGVVFPLSFAIVAEVLPRGKVSTAIGILTGGFGFGAVLGFPFGGLITQQLSWRWIFGVGAVALGFAIILVRLTVPPVGQRVRRRLDAPGALLFGSAMAALIVGITEAPHRGWASPLPIGMFVVAAAAAVGWYVRETRTAEPLMDLRVLSSRGVLLTNVTAFLGGYAVFGVNVLLPFLLAGTGQIAPMTAFGLSSGPLLIGVVLLPRAFGQVVGGPVAGPVARLLGIGAGFSAGMLLVAVATFGLAFFRTSLWMLLAELLVLGIGFGTVITLSGSIVALSARPGETGIATSITSVLRRAGGAIGAQVSIGLLTLITVSGGSEPADAAFTVSFATAGVVSVAGAISAAFVAPRRRATSG